MTNDFHHFYYETNQRENHSMLKTCNFPCYCEIRLQTLEQLVKMWKIHEIYYCFTSVHGGKKIMIAKLKRSSKNK